MHSVIINDGFEQALLDSISTSTVILDCHGVIRFANKAWRKFATENGRDPIHSDIGTNYLAVCDAATGEHSDDAKVMAAGIRSVLTGTHDQFVINYPCDALTEARWFIGKITRIEHKGVIWLSVAHEEVSELRRMEMHLATALHEVNAANLAKSRFLSTMSHEIRTPLSAISGMAKLIEREPLSPNQYEKLQKLEVAVRHLSSTINNILDLAKIEADKLVLEQSPLDISHIVEEVASIVQISLDRKGLKLHVTLDVMPAGLTGDPTRLRQALLNFVGNAIKFTSQGIVRLHASVVEDLDASALLRLEVQDKGVGIAPEAIPTLFEPFVQADSSTSRRYGGSGLGLSITKKLVQAMGGEVGVSSVVGTGSTFWLTVRLIKNAEPDAPMGAVQNQNAASTLVMEYPGRRVLLADDDEFNREVGCILLQDVGMVVDEAEDGQVAHEMASRNAYDLILMDIQMPNLDGLDATRKIRSSGTGTLVPIVALTANAFVEDKARCLEAGMNDFITKPVDPSVLYQVMLDIFKRQSASSGLGSARHPDPLQ
jgi:signal transduction histidine kinase/CheY-like chemotaxis protein